MAPAAFAGELAAMAAAVPPTTPKKFRRSEVKALFWLVTRALVPLARRTTETVKRFMFVYDDRQS